MTCHPQSSIRWFRHKKTFDWVIEGSLAKGNVIRLRNPFHGDCYLGTCGGHACGGGYGLNCYTKGSVRFRTYPTTTQWKVASPGPIVGRWERIQSGHRVTGEVKYVVGKTSTTGSELSRGISATLTTTLSQTVGFAKPTGGPSSSTTATVEVSATTDVRETYRKSVALAETRWDSFRCEKQDKSHNRWWMYQWVVDVPYLELGREKSAVVRTPATLCLSCLNCQGPLKPACALDHCSNDDCSTCH